MKVSADRILFVLHGAIGDVVRALPLLNRVRAAYPQASIAWAVEPIAAPLLEGHPAIDQRIVFDRARGARAFAPFLRQVRAFGADLTLDLQRHLKSGVVSFASRAPVRLGFDRSNSNEANWLFNTHHLPPMEHFSLKWRQYLAFADVLELSATAITFGLAPTDEERAHVDELLDGASGPLAPMFVGSTWPSRFWFAAASAEVVRQVSARGLQPVLVGVASEVAFADEIAGLAGVPVINLAGRTRLRDLVALFARSSVAIGPDSGPMHIAAAMGCPVVSLWGATSPKRSAPYGSEHLIVQGEAKCVPCYRKTCPIGRVCMQSITPAAVLAQIDAGLAERTHDGSKI
ncbi:MAG: glycosyltransferase family 9 protein [Deltaproteobacteria bacterium]|nr:glycosyltransferase family 9 protein [Deltaproteobacteria bacterium]MBI3387314.1 glycosyltransferase family 9 protein [Deltaproteobacteria bacterium]